MIFQLLLFAYLLLQCTTGVDQYHILYRQVKIHIANLDNWTKTANLDNWTKNANMDNWTKNANLDNWTKNANLDNWTKNIRLNFAKVMIH